MLHASYEIRWPSDPLVFFWVAPIFMALFLVSRGGRERWDSVQMLDFAQILILTMAAYLAFLFVPSEWQAAGRWMAKRGWDTTNVRDPLLTAGLAARAFFSHSRLVQSLFRRLAAFFLLYQLADLVYHYEEEVQKVTTGSLWDLLWSAPFVAAIAFACTWDWADEKELVDTGAQQRSVRQLLFLLSAFMSLPVLLVAVKVQKETPVLGAALVAASLLCSGARLFITQRRRDQSEVLQSALYRIAEKASTFQNTQELSAAIHGILGGLMYARNLYIALYDEPSQTISFAYFQDEVDAFQPGPISSGRGLTEYVLRSGEPLLAGPEVFQGLLQRGEVESIGAPSVD